MLGMLDALPTYNGAKGKLAPRIFAELRTAGVTAGATLADPFMGGGSISLLGKALGYRVVANDISARSEALGQAFIENDRIILGRDEVAAALETAPKGWYVPPVDAFPWTEDSRDLFARLAKAADQAASPAKAALLRALIFKAISLMAFYLQLGSTAGQRTREGRFDEMTPSQQARAQNWFTRPRKAILRATENLRPAVFPNGNRNTMSRGDVLEFLPAVAGEADAVYLDPPYADTMGYEDAFAVVDALLEGRESTLGASRFSEKDGWRFLGEVFDAAADIPTWVVSLGNKAVALEQLEEMLRERGREVRSQEIAYMHMASLSSEERKQENREYLLVATAKVAAHA